MGACCDSEGGAASRPAGDALEKRGKSGGGMGKGRSVDIKAKFANRDKIILGYWKIRGLA